MSQSLTEGGGEIRASVNAVRGPCFNYLKLNCDHFIYLNYDHFSPREDDLNLHPESSSIAAMICNVRMLRYCRYNAVL